MAERLRDKYRRAFFAGLATLLPTVLTIFVLTFCYNFIKNNFAGPINSLIEAQLRTDFAKERYWKGVWNLQDWEVDDKVDENRANDIPLAERVDAHVPEWVGFVIAVILVLVVGFLFKGYLGRQLLRSMERWAQKLPIIKVIYPYAKQITEFFFEGRRPIQYQSAVAVQYPRKGIWSVGFVTSESFQDVQRESKKDVVAIFIPSSPTPFTGYTIVVPKDDVLNLNLTVDEALRFTISAGVLLPPQQLPPLALKTRKIERPEEGSETPASTEERRS